MKRTFFTGRFCFAVNFILLFFLAGQGSFSQSYGLFFSSLDVPRKERTGIDLDNDGFFSFSNSFEIKFDIKFRYLQKFQYGYIARIITREGQNIDIVYNQGDGPEIVVVCQQKISSIEFKLEPGQAFNRWHTFSLYFDLSNDRLVLATSDTSYVEEEAGLSGAKDFKILFGENQYKIFETGNVAPMDIKDIFINEDKSRSYHWPLNEQSGEIARDVIHGRKALVNNPVWLTIKHQRWEMLKSVALDGSCRIVYDERDGNIILVGDNQLVKFSLQDRKTISNRYKTGRPALAEGSRGFIDPNTNSLYTYSYDQGIISNYHEKDSSWGYDPFLSSKGPALRHYNSFFIPRDKSLYLTGGFNGTEYKNQVSKLDLSSGKWKKVTVGGDEFYPRYLSALGLNKTLDTAFILGGYGSNSGNPILNPHFYSDLYSYSINDSTFKKIYDYDNTSEYYFFANTMIIDTSGENFYVLRFNISRSENELQLLQGSLTKPDWQVKADRIPYNFQESRSYADLFMDKTSNTLVAVTAEYSDSTNQSTVNIYSVFYPPNTSEEIINDQATSKKVLYWFIIIIGFDILILIIVTVRNRIRKHSLANLNNRAENQDSSFFSSNLLKSTWEDGEDKTRQGRDVPFILLFGGFQFNERKGEDISGKFSPLLKELFLLILLNTVSNGKGISSKNLVEQLWWDKSPESAKNNLAVNIGKLRNIMGPSLSGLLVNKSGHWKFELEGNEKVLYCDYWEYRRLIKSNGKTGKDEILRIIEIVKRGKFLANSTYEWLDTFKADISNEISDVFLDFSKHLSISKDTDLVIKIADSISTFDMINENAMEMKCKALVYYGKHSLARDIYSKFVRDYRDLYGEPYSRDFNSIIE